MKRLLLFSTMALSACSSLPREKEVVMKKNPSYVVINDETQSKERRAVLKTRAEDVSFPLTREDTHILNVLEAKFDAEENCAGLAAPQIGFSKRMIVFAAPDDPDLKKWRKDFTQTMGKTLWINPSYEGIDETMHEDFEGCFSVNDLAGPVQRYSKIKYAAFLPDGTPVQGEAEGFLARIIQHEIDHLNGILCIDRMPQDKIMSIEAYRKLRESKMKSSESS